MGFLAVLFLLLCLLRVSQGFAVLPRNRVGGSQCRTKALFLFGRSSGDNNETALPKKNEEGTKGKKEGSRGEKKSLNKKDKKEGDAGKELEELKTANVTASTENETESGREEEECLLLDDMEKEAVLANRQQKVKKKSPLRSWVGSFVSFLVVIGVGTIGTMWESTSTRYFEDPAILPSPRISMLEEDSAFEQGSGLLDSSEELPSDPRETIAPRERHFTASRRLDFPNPQRGMAMAYVKEAVQRVSPSVLRIDTETHLQHDDNKPGWLQEGQGSGVIFSSKGLILTNAHVVDGTSKVTVTLSDGRVFHAEVTGSDEVTDIAVLRILPDGGDVLEDFAVADFGDSDDLEVGQFVVALGSPGGLDMTATMGIVSGLRRSPADVGLSHKKVDYIQTDAALNPGNSGGPLVDVESGCIVGINACIRSNMEGTSFSIPINKVQEILHDLSTGVPVHHSYIGASMADCTPTWARKLNNNNKDMGWKIPEVHGALVSKVHPDSPAAAAGLQMNDVIVDVAGTKITSSDDASRFIDRAPVGKDLTVAVIRDGNTVNLRVRPVDLATRLREVRAERQRQQRRRPRKLFEDVLPLQNFLDPQYNQ